MELDIKSHRARHIRELESSKAAILQEEDVMLAAYWSCIEKAPRGGSKSCHDNYMTTCGAYMTGVYAVSW